MAGMNSVHLVGRVGKDPDYRRFDNGGELLEFSLATSESWRDRNSGERREKTQWHTIKITAEAVIKIGREYVRSGDLVGIEGKLEYRQWEKDGQKHTRAEIVVDFGGRLHLLGSKNGNGDGNSRGSSNDRGGSGRNERRNDDYGSRSSGSRSGSGSSRQSNLHDDLDDTIPF